MRLMRPRLLPNRTALLTTAACFSQAAVFDRDSSIAWEQVRFAQRLPALNFLSCYPSQVDMLMHALGEIE
jgi:hypothetical protein